MLTLTGVASAEWDHTPAPVAEDACSRTERSEGVRRVRFRSRPMLVHVTGGRLIGTDVRGIRGSVSVGGALTIETRCGAGGGSAEIRDCVTTSRSFSGAAMRLRSRAGASLAFDAVRGVRLGEVSCPTEPPAVRRAPAGISPRPIRLPVAQLADPRTRRLVLRVSVERRASFGAPEAGQLEQTAQWTLTFERVKG